MRTRKLDIEREIEALGQLNKAELGERWAKLTARPVPKVSAALLRLALAWELQAAVHGGLSRRTSQRLGQLAAGKTHTRETSPDMRLVREWKGKLHVVTIDTGGVVHWNDKPWPSLSAVARAITGTRWSGPAFFGLKQKAKAA